MTAPVLGHCVGGMTAERPESPLSNFLSDVLREACLKHFGKRADVGLYNMGGIRSVMPAGEVTQGHIFEIAPFENYLCLLTLRGEDLMELCRNIAATGGEGISGLRITATRNGQLVNATVGTEPITAEREYTVATLNYLAEGNDHMTALTRAIHRHDTTIPVREIIMDTIRQATAEGRSITGQCDGRMTIVADGSAPHMAPPHPTASRTVRILHTNDTHSQIMPYNPNSVNRDMADKAGFVRRATFIENERMRTPDLLLVDAGDFSQGSLYYNLYRGEVEVTMMNQMGYDAATIGNHEFDFGLENMARLMRMARFAFVCCNYDFTGTSCEGLVKPYIVIERAGARIGVTGIGCALEGMVARQNCEGVTYSDPRKVLPEIVREMREQEGCDIVVCLSHVGWGDDEGNDASVIEATEGIDLVIGGHSHTYMELPQWVRNARGNEIPCYQMGKMGRYIGDITIDF